MKRIPKSMLYHTASYEAYNGGSWESEYDAPVPIENVLIQPVSSINRDNNVDGKQFNSLMFYDPLQSTPGIEFKVGSRLTFDGQTMTVEEVNKLYAFNNEIHHIEVGLR